MKQGDVLRYMLMHSFGGLYLDLDVDCYSTVDESLGNYTIVLQGTGGEGVTNAMMASAPKVSFWLEVLYTCQERANADFPVWATGPTAVGDTIQKLYHLDPVLKLGFLGEVIEVRCPYSSQMLHTLRLGRVVQPKPRNDGYGSIKKVCAQLSSECMPCTVMTIEQRA